MKIIIYGSQYGTTKQYAEAFGRRTGIEVRRCDEIEDVDAYDTIVYFGALYAGGVMGMKKTLGRLASAGDRRIVIATVGLTDPLDAENAATIEKGMKKQLSEDVFEHARIFHLRGGIDYARLGLAHRAMMALLYQKAIGLPKEKQTAEVKAMIETYGKKVEFTDLSRLDEMIGSV